MTLQIRKKADKKTAEMCSNVRFAIGCLIPVGWQGTSDIADYQNPNTWLFYTNFHRRTKYWNATISNSYPIRVRLFVLIKLQNLKEEEGCCFISKVNQILNIWRKTTSPDRMVTSKIDLQFFCNVWIVQHSMKNTWVLLYLPPAPSIMEISSSKSEITACQENL